MLTDRIAAMAQGLRTIAGQADPVGEVTEWDQPTGLHIRRVRTLADGVIYEPSECHGRCGGLVPEIGKCGYFARRPESLHSAGHSCLFGAGVAGRGSPEDGSNRPHP